MRSSHASCNGILAFLIYAANAHRVLSISREHLAFHGLPSQRSFSSLNGSRTFVSTRTISEIER